MFRSISSQLQFSYGSLVVLALVGVGMFGYQHQKSEMLRIADETLQNRARQISALLVRYDLGELRTFAQEPTDESIPPLPGQPVSSGKEESTTRDHRYRVWKAGGGKLEPVFQSTVAPAWSGSVPLPRDLDAYGVFRIEGNQRQFLSRAVRNYVVLISLDLTSQQESLRQFLIRMVLAEIAFLALFLLAGHWLTRRALQPISEISATARTISEGALDRRIPGKGGSSELSDLSKVLNETFDRLEAGITKQRKFTADASHELRTPITAILAEAQSRPQTLTEHKESLRRCEVTARSMGKLVDQLLELARFDAEEVQLVREPTDLDLLVNRAVGIVRPHAEEKSIRIEARLEVIQAVVNPVRLQQVVLNLLHNAVSYTGAGGLIRVRLRETESAIELSVEDNGIGIEESCLPRIFDRFFRADESRSDHEKDHFGLGLAISREIAEAHGGDLKVKSEFGKGSTFTLVIPAPTAS